MNNYEHISFKRRWDFDSITTMRLGLCESLIELLKTIPLSPSLRDKMYMVSLEKGAHATTAIEGNTLSESEVGDVNNNRPVRERKGYEEKEVKNVLKALNELRHEIVDLKIKHEITPDIIRDFHKKIGKDLDKEYFKADPGVFRSYPVSVGDVYSPPNCKYIEKYVNELCIWLKKEIFVPFASEKDCIVDSIIKAVVAHVYIAWIHPFGDGNGRTARLVEFYILLKNGLPDYCSHILSNHYNNTRSEYYNQLKEAGKTGDLTNFISYAINGLLDGLNKIKKEVIGEVIYVSWQAYIRNKLSEEISNDKIKRRLLNILEGLKPNKEYSLKEILFASSQISHNYADSSSRLLIRDVKKLSDMKLLVSDKPSTYKLNIVAMLTTQD